MASGSATILANWRTRMTRHAGLLVETMYNGEAVRRGLGLMRRDFH
jgi:hypothetical protein